MDQYLLPENLTNPQGLMSFQYDGGAPLPPAVPTVAHGRVAAAAPVFGDLAAPGAVGVPDYSRLVPTPNGMV